MIRRQSSLRYLWWPPSSPRPATPSQRTKSPTATHHRPSKLGVVLWRCPLLRGAQLAPPLAPGLSEHAPSHHHRAQHTSSFEQSEWFTRNSEITKLNDILHRPSRPHYSLAITSKMESKSLPTAFPIPLLLLLLLPLIFSLEYLFNKIKPRHFKETPSLF